MPYTNIEDIKAAMQEMDGRDCDTWWWVRNGEIACGLNANDLFYWATADLEFLEPEDLPDLRQAKKDCLELRGDDDWPAVELFICRKRKMRPQRPCYKNYPEVLHPLFDACGPEQGNRG